MNGTLSLQPRKAKPFTWQSESDPGLVSPESWQPWTRPNFETPPACDDALAVQRLLLSRKLLPSCSSRVLPLQLTQSSLPSGRGLARTNRARLPSLCASTDEEGMSSEGLNEAGGLAH